MVRILLGLEPDMQERRIYLDPALPAWCSRLEVRKLRLGSDEVRIKAYGGQFVTAGLQVSIRPNALLVPTQAIQTGQQGSFVFVVKKDLTVESRPVVPGVASGQDTLVDASLQPGEQVVTDGQIRLVPGARVAVKEGSGGGPATPAGAAGGAGS